MRRTTLGLILLFAPIIAFFVWAIVNIVTMMGPMPLVALFAIIAWYILCMWLIKG